MARTRRTRRYRRRSGRWSSNIQTLANITTSTPANSTFFTYRDLAANPVQDNTTVSQKYTVKNVELTYEIDASDANSQRYLESMVSYIMYVPEGYAVTETLPNLHPEWIMAYRFLGSPNVELSSSTASSAVAIGPGRNPLRIKTRLARTLNTGDKIILLITGINTDSNARSFDYNGIVRWWTKAN